MSEFVVIPGAGNSFKTQEEAVEYAKKLHKQRRVSKYVSDELYIMKKVQTVTNA